MSIRLATGFRVPMLSAVCRLMKRVTTIRLERVLDGQLSRVAGMEVLRDDHQAGTGFRAERCVSDSFVESDKLCADRWIRCSHKSHGVAFYLQPRKIFSAPSDGIARGSSVA